MDTSSNGDQEEDELRLLLAAAIEEAEGASEEADPAAQAAAAAENVGERWHHLPQSLEYKRGSPHLAEKLRQRKEELKEIVYKCSVRFHGENLDPLKPSECLVYFLKHTGFLAMVKSIINAQLWKENETGVTDFKGMQMLVAMLTECIHNLSPEALFAMWEKNDKSVEETGRPKYMFSRPQFLDDYRLDEHIKLMKALDEGARDNELFSGHRCSTEGSFQSPRTPPKSVVVVLEKATAVLCDFLVVPSATDISHDDDQIASSSKQMGTEGYKQRRIADKRDKSGINLNSLVTTLGLWVGGCIDFNTDQRSTEGILRDLIQTMKQGCGTVEGVTFALDRGFSHDGSLMTVQEEGANFIATVQNSNRTNANSAFATTDATLPRTAENIKQLNERGRTKARFAMGHLKRSATNQSQQSNNATSRMSVMNCGLVTGRGKLLSLKTNISGVMDPALVTIKYKSQAPSRAEGASSSGDGNAASNSSSSSSGNAASEDKETTARRMMSEVLQKVVQLTQVQRCKAWFVLRKFRFTSKSAKEVLQVLSIMLELQRALGLPQTLSQFGAANSDGVLSALGFPVSPPETLAVATQANPSTTKKKSFNTSVASRVKSMPALKQYLLRNNVELSAVSSGRHNNTGSDSNRVEQTFNGLLEHLPSGLQSIDVLLSNLNARFMQAAFLNGPVTHSMRVGLEAEGRVAKSINKFLSGNLSTRSLRCVTELGLVASQRCSGVCGSVDRVAVCYSSQVPSFEAVAIEIKTLQGEGANGTKAQVQRIADEDPFPFIHVKQRPLPNGVLSKVISRDNLTQCVHHCVTLDLDTCWLVLATSSSSTGMGTIKAIVTITVDRAFRRNYEMLSQNIYEAALSWTKPPLSVGSSSSSVATSSSTRATPGSESSTSHSTSSSVHSSASASAAATMREDFGTPSNTTTREAPLAPPSAVGEAAPLSSSSSTSNSASTSSTTSSVPTQPDTYHPFNSSGSDFWIADCMKSDIGDAKADIIHSIAEIDVLLSELESMRHPSSGLPPVQDIKFVIVDLWNRLKWGVDQLSEATARLKSGMRMPHTHLKVFRRILQNLSMNAERIPNILEKNPRLANARTLDHFQSILSETSSNGFGRQGTLIEAVSCLHEANLSAIPNSPQCTAEPRSTISPRVAQTTFGDDWVQHNVAPELAKLGSISRSKKAQLFNKPQLSVFRIHANMGSEGQHRHSAKQTENHQHRCVLCCTSCENDPVEETSRTSVPSLQDAASSTSATRDHNATLTESRSGRPERRTTRSSSSNRESQNAKKHVVSGFKTKWYCGICKVALCRKQRVQWGGRSCFDVWHKYNDLPCPPCEANSQASSSASAANSPRRRPLPRQRSPSLGISSNEALSRTSRKRSRVSDNNGATAAEVAPGTLDFDEADDPQ